ncbi:type II toxin-antitoxin system RelE/ParE family toxin [bacterium]|nr:type II toxin-antitoxin system RelE/ParE family toxin [bacterium]MBU1599662.1 type II toxin-antitoxin system RelE/ParE family toxin [bacterium]MBU2461423.1 type II toxin-antitoxin system RelE/ParE family toxin [bacterium]
MSDYKVKLSNKASKQLEDFPKDLQKRVINALLKLKGDPKIGKPLKWKYKGDWSFRVGNYRIVYIILNFGKNSKFQKFLSFPFPSP